MTARESCCGRNADVMSLNTMNPMDGQHTDREHTDGLPRVESIFCDMGGLDGQTLDVRTVDVPAGH